MSFKIENHKRVVEIYKSKLREFKSRSLIVKEIAEEETVHYSTVYRIITDEMDKNLRDELRNEK